MDIVSYEVLLVFSNICVELQGVLMIGTWVTEPIFNEARFTEIE